MRKITIILLVLIASINSIAQDVVGSRVIAKQSFFLRNTWIDSLRRDTLNWASDFTSLPTAGAVYKFVNGRTASGGFFNPNQTSTGNTLHNGNNKNFEVDSASNMTFRLKKDDFSQFDIYAGRGFYAEVQGIDGDGNNYYGYYDLFDVFNEIYLENGTGKTMFSQTPSTSGSSTLIWSKVGSNGSFVGIEEDRIYLDARNGVLQLGNLTNLSTQDRLLGQLSSSTQVGYITFGTGLNLASGVLTSNTPYAADAGSNDTYVITLSPAATAYTTGMMVEFKANTANTGAATITINGLGAKTIVKRVNTTLADGDIAASMFCVLVYDGSQFVLINPITN